MHSDEEHLDERHVDEVAGVAPAAPAAIVEITGLAAGGDGIARLPDGRVVFVDGAAPGDRVELAELREGRRLARARVGRLRSPGPDRVAPRCAHFGRCGGCRWQHVRYEAQLQAKRRIVRDALERIGGLALESDPEITRSPADYGYRARARLVEQEGQIGFRPRGANRVVPIEECPVLVPGAEAALGRLRDEARDRHRRRGGATRRRRVVTREWELFAVDAETVRIGRVATRGGVDRGAPAVEIAVLGERLRVSAGSFAQGNALLWDALAREVVSQCAGVADDSGAEAAGEAPKRFVELYAGVGFLTLPLVRRGLTGVALESARPALADLAANLEAAGLSERVEILAGRAEGRGDLERRLAQSDLLLVDPPRTGLGGDLRAQIARSGPRRVVYVSCDPATLARDLRPLVAGGYRLVALRAFDLFPQTPHVEVVVRLERAAA